MVLYFELLTNWDGDVKHGKRAGDIEEQGSKGEMSAGASPLIEHRVQRMAIVTWRFQAHTFYPTQIQSLLDFP